MRFVVTNRGMQGVYFKQPWKWASDGLRLVATGTDGSAHESSAVLFDLDSKYVCTYFKPLAPGDSFSFGAVVGKGELSAVLPLSRGRYKLRWVYEPKIYPDEASCTAASWPIWHGHAESPELDLDVE